VLGLISLGQMMDETTFAVAVVFGGVCMSTAKLMLLNRLPCSEYGKTRAYGPHEFVQVTVRPVPWIDSVIGNALLTLK
jgi:hypothetical protein